MRNCMRCHGKSYKNTVMCMHNDHCCRDSTSTVLRSSSSTACARTCARRYNVLDAAPGIQILTDFSFVCLNRGHLQRFAIWSHNHTRIIPIYLSLQTHPTPNQRPKQNLSPNANASVKDPWHIFKRRTAVVGSRQLTLATSHQTV